MVKRSASSRLSSSTETDLKRHKDAKYSEMAGSGKSTTSTATAHGFGNETKDPTVPRSIPDIEVTPGISTSPFRFNNFNNYDVNPLTPVQAQENTYVTENSKQRADEVPLPINTELQAQKVILPFIHNYQGQNETDETLSNSTKSVWASIYKKATQYLSLNATQSKTGKQVKASPGPSSSSSSFSSSSTLTNAVQSAIKPFPNRIHRQAVNENNDSSSTRNLIPENQNQAQSLITRPDTGESDYLDFLDIYEEEVTEFNDMESRGRTMSKSDIPISAKREYTPVGRFRKRIEDDLLKDLENCEPHIVPDFTPAKFDSSSSSVYETGLDEQVAPSARHSYKSFKRNFGQPKDKEIEVVNDCDTHDQISNAGLGNGDYYNYQSNINTEYLKANYVIEDDRLDRKESKKFGSIKRSIQKVKQNINGTIKNTFSYLNNNSENGSNGEKNKGENNAQPIKGEYNFGFTSKSQSKKFKDVVLIKNKKGEIRKIDFISSRILLIENEPSRTLFFPNGTIMEDFFKNILIYRIKTGKVKVFEIHNRQYITIELKED